MKKITICLGLLLLSIPGFSQLFKAVKIDSLVTVSLPPIYQKKDSLGKQIFTAKSSYGFIVVSRIPNAKNNTALKKEKDLNKVFKNYTKDIQQIGNGAILNERDTLIGALKCRLFTLQTQDADGPYHDRDFLILYTQEVTYTFEYFYDAIRADLVKNEVKTYFGSIKLAPDLQRNDQYLSTGSSGMSSSIKLILFGGGGFIVVLITVFVAIRRKKKERSAKN